MYKKQLLHVDSEWLAQRRRQLMAIHKDADPNDIEFELALDMNGQ